MYQVYMGEVKYCKTVEPFYWLCSLAFPENAIPSVEQQLKDFLDANENLSETAFVAKDLVQGEGFFKGYDEETKLNIMNALMDCVERCNELKRIEIRLEPLALNDESYEHVATQFFVEKLFLLLHSKQTTAKLISGKNLESFNEVIAQLKGNQKPCFESIRQDEMAENRLLQLADVYAYTKALCARDELSKMEEKIVAVARSKKKFGYPDKYKYYPSDNSWYEAI